MTARDALRIAEPRLAQAGIPRPDLDAERLLRFALDCDQAHLIAHPERILDASQKRTFLESIARRCRREPLQHIVGEQEFWRHSFEVSPAALIPRPETEGLMEAALQCLAGTKRPIVVDVGTGTGCLALSLAAERRDAEVHAVDISPQALELAQRNARRLRQSGVHFHLGSWLDPVAALVGRIDLVISNPPYVDPTTPDLAPEVADHDPALALFPAGGVYAAYETLVPQAATSLRPGGWLVLELGAGLADGVAQIVSGSGLCVHDVSADLQGIPRTLVAQRPPADAAGTPEA
jgi:release factor glutamine methyltransferase